jgi:hypothetical protein
LTEIWSCDECSVFVIFLPIMQRHFWIGPLCPFVIASGEAIIFYFEWIL